MEQPNKGLLLEFHELDCLGPVSTKMEQPNKGLLLEFHELDCLGPVSTKMEQPNKGLLLEFHELHCLGPVSTKMEQSRVSSAGLFGPSINQDGAVESFISWIAWAQYQPRWSSRIKGYC
ncbi:hypothetical protein RRG08_045341 [Elysia crispata]|uniref:Uncharacterized protein n=1 Tax=Elysia crispata TaxID=231223 RepID=A0AAE1DQS8_9GAST|nr:hypothetical protein RRG08_045341 [Elysia crispata]